MPTIQKYVQAPPFAVQVELTEGCNLRCSFCGLNGIRGKRNDFKFMTLDTAEKIAGSIRENKWNSRIEFAMHGEPSANPDMIEIVKVFRDRLPKASLMMTSNGFGFVKDPTNIVDGVLQHLNILALDWYQNVSLVPKILEGYKGVHTVRHYPKEPEANPHRRREGSLFVVIQDIEQAEKGTHSSLNNHCGAGSPLDYSANGKRCAKPFREISFRWDGRVSLCCNDWRGTYECGSIHEESVASIWNSAAFQAARKKLYHGQRDFGPCNGCNALSYRPGLLPDQRGKISLPLPSESDLRVIEEVTGRPPMTLPVLRTWEIQPE